MDPPLVWPPCRHLPDVSDSLLGPASSPSSVSPHRPWHWLEGEWGWMDPLTSPLLGSICHPSCTQHLCPSCIPALIHAWCDSWLWKIFLVSSRAQHHGCSQHPALSFHMNRLWPPQIALQAAEHRDRREPFWSKLVSSLVLLCLHIKHERAAACRLQGTFLEDNVTLNKESCFFHYYSMCYVSEEPGHL